MTLTNKKKGGNIGSTSTIISEKKYCVNNANGGFTISPLKTEEYVQPKKFYYTLKTKDKQKFLPDVEKLIKNNILLSQPYYYYHKESKKMEYAIKYFFIESDYDKLSLITSHNNYLFEVIPESAHVKPYFDLEIERKDITKKECNMLLDLFIKILIYEYKQMFAINLKRSDIVILDSCKTSKLSYHVIVNNNMYFEDNSEQKCFIDYLLYNFRNSDGLPEFYVDAIDKLIWKKSDHDNRQIFDTIPYSRLQNFRCVNQSKFTIKVKSEELIGEYVKTKDEKIFDKMCVESDNNVTLKIISDHKMNDTFVRVFDVSKMKKLNVDHINKFIVKKINAVSKTNIDKPEKVSKYKINNESSTVESTHDLKNICTRGDSLFYLDKMKINELLKMEKFKQYLYLISSQNSYVVWMAIGFSIASCGGSKDDWYKFSKMNNAKYNEGECNRFVNFKKSGQVFGLSYLRKLAKLCNPTICQKIDMDILGEYFDVDLEGLIVVEESNDFISHVFNATTQKYEFDGKIISKDKFLIIKGNLGKGKTTAIKIILKNKGYKKILFLSPRITFSYFIKSEFDCDIYLEKLDSDNIVCQLESISKLQVDKFDCIIIDESESVLKQFSSPTMTKPLSVWKSLTEYIKNAKKVILADAFITRRTIDFCKDIRQENDKILYFINTSKSIKRKAVQIKERDMEDKILDDVTNGKNVYGCFSTKKALMSLEKSFEVLQKRCDKFKGKRGLFYHSLKNDTYDKSLLNMNVEWKREFVGVTPKVTVGCSFGDKNHFDRAYVNAKPTCCVRDTMQSIMRARHLKENLLYFSLPKSNNMSFCASDFMRKCYDSKNENKKNTVNYILEKLLEHEDNEDKIIELKNYISMFKENEIPKALEKILFFNMYEDYLSRSNYRMMFIEFLNLCNYDVEFIGEDDEKESKKKKKLKDSDIEHNLESYEDRYDDIQNITMDRYNKIKFKISGKSADEIEKLEFEKFAFCKMFKNDTDNSILADIFFNVFLRTGKKHIVYNVYHMKNMDLVKNLLKDMNNKEKVFELQNFSSIQAIIVTDLVTLMGLRHCQDTETVIDKRIVCEDVNKYLVKNYNKICSIFNLSGKKLDDDESKKNSQLFNMLKSIFLKWCGNTLKANDIDAHEKVALNYTLNGKNFFVHMTEFTKNEKNIHDKKYKK